MGKEYEMVEQSLAVAHRALWRAARWAEHRSDQQLADDIYSVAGEVGRIHLSLVKPTRARRASARVPA